MAAFQFYLQSGTTVPGERGSVIQQSVLPLPKFGMKSSHIFMHAVTVKVTGVCGIDCLACQDQFFVNSPLDIKENDEHAHDVALHLLLGGLLLCLMVRMSCHK
jgi:hypothetical protein